MTFKWTDVKFKAFDKSKQIVACNNLLAYKYPNKLFNINTDDIEFQLGMVITQEVKLIALYSRKLTITKKLYVNGKVTTNNNWIHERVWTILRGKRLKYIQTIRILPVKIKTQIEY